MALVVPKLPDIIETKIKNFHLGPNNFTFGQDERMSVLPVDCPAPTTMQADYVRWNAGRADAAVPPTPAAVLSKDARHFNTRRSETHAVYSGPDPAPAPPIDRNKLRATNFKMDGDTRKFKLYDTSNAIDYPAKELSEQQPAKSLMLSHIPQGDPDKVGRQRTDYQHFFPAHTANKPEHAHCLHFDPSNCTKGDARQSGYETSQKLEFPAKELPFTQPFPHQRGGNIPVGDKEKEMTRSTTTADAFPAPDVKDLSTGYDKSKVISTILKTNHNERDGLGPSRSTTMKESYIPQTSKYEVFKPNISRNHSDCPEGDDDPNRERVRASRTTNSMFFNGHKDARKPRIVQGSEIFTQSRVNFGDPAQEKHQYDTTMRDEFTRKHTDYKYDRYPSTKSILPLDYYRKSKAEKEEYDPIVASRNKTKSFLPLDYYPGLVESSIYKGAYPDPMTKRMALDPTAENDLRRSHIRMPLVGEQLFSTEHKDKFTRKGVDTHSFNRHHLQRSSLPIGSLNQSIHLDEIVRKGR